MPNPSAHPHRSWRKSGGNAGSEVSRSAAKWLSTFFALALLAAFGLAIYWLWSVRVPQTHFVAILTGETHKFTVPPLPFAHEDLAPLQQTALRSFQYYDRSELQEADKITGLGQWLRGLTVKDRDVLLLYLSAHGVSDGGIPFLLCRDFDLGSRERARYALVDLLTELKAFSVRTKLLVLDAGWILADPRLGMVVNEFPRLVIEQVAQWDDPTLWVLLTSSPQQSPQVMRADERTVFGHSFLEGLLGGADRAEAGGNGDGFVALDELFPFVVEQCRNRTAGGQTPILVRCGQPLEALNRIPPHIRLTRIPAPARTEEAAAQPSDDPQPKAEAGVRPGGAEQAPAKETPAAAAPTTSEQAAPAPSPAQPSPSGDSGEKAAAADAKPPSAPVPSPAADSPAGVPAVPAPSAEEPQDERTRLRHVLAVTWQERDRLDAFFESPERWSPIEFAPAAWRELNALLLDIDLRCRAGRAFDAGQLRRQVEAQLDRLRAFNQEAGSAPSPTAAPLAADRLLVAAQLFGSSAERATFGGDPELEAVGRAVRSFYRLSLRLPEYLRWSAETHWRWPGYQRLEELEQQIILLADVLQRFDQELAARRGERLPGPAADDPLVGLARNLQQARAAIEAIVRDQVDFLVTHVDQPAYRHCIEGLLQTSVPTAAQRERLVESLTAARPELSAAMAPVAVFPQPRSVPAARWQHVARQLRLDARLLKLAGTPEAGSVESSLAALEQALASASDDDQVLWQGCRTAGQAFETYYRSLRDQLRSAAEPRRDLLVRWLDARDLDFISAADQRVFFPRLALLPPRQPDRLEVTQTPAGTIRLGPQAEVVEIEIRHNNPEVGSVSLLPVFDTQRLQVQTAEGKTLQAGRPLPIQLEANQTARVKLQVQVVAGTAGSGGGEYPIAIEFQAGELKQQHAVVCIIPKPNDIELLVERIQPREAARRFGRNATELRPLANRTTHFRFLLANLSDGAQQVDVALYRIPDTVWAPGRLVDEYGEPFADVQSWLFQTGTDRLLPGMEPVARTARPVSLPADGRPREIDLSPQPPEPAKAEEASKPPASTEQPPAPAGPEPIDVTNGLACVITSVADPNERWVKWIEVNPLTPRDYLKPDVYYDLDERQIRIEVRALDADGDGLPDRLPPPPELAAQPIIVEWDTADVVAPGAERNSRAVIDRPQGVGQLSARVDHHPTRSALIRLNVDGFPRAFLYELSLSRSNAGRDVRRNARSIRVVSLQMDGENRIYRTVEPIRRPEPPAEKAPEVYLLRGGEAAAFPVGSAGRPLLVGVQVDAPLDAFAFRDRNDMVEIGFTRPGFSAQRRFSDRYTRVWIDRIAPDRLAVTSEVRDFDQQHAIPLDVQGLKNARLRIQARLSLRQDEPPPHELEVVIDGELPVLDRWTSPATVEQGQPIPISVQIMDLSGPAKAELGVVARRDDPLKEDQSRVYEDFEATPAQGRWVLNASLDSAQLKPGDYFVKTFVTDRVGQRAQLERAITVRPPRPIPEKKPGPVMGTLRGVVQFGPTYKPDGIRVQIKNSSFPPATTRGGGQFQFDKVPAGRYTLEAQGPVRGALKYGQIELEVQTKEDFARPVVIPLGNPPDR